MLLYTCAGSEKSHRAGHSCELSAGEIAAARELLAQFGHSSDTYSLTVERHVADYGPATRLVHLELANVQGTYTADAASAAWLDALRADLVAGHYQPR